MTYLNLIPAILVIAAYFLGRYIGRHSHDAELTKLRAENTRLATMLDFTQAECEHVAGLLGKKVANAHTDGAELKIVSTYVRDEGEMQATLNRSLKWCEGHRQYDLCHLP